MRYRVRKSERLKKFGTTINSGSDKFGDYKILSKFPDYRIYSDGSIFSYRRKTIPKKLSFSINNAGYFQTCLTNIDNKAVQMTVHPIIAAAFHGPPNDDQVVRHLDSNPRNNNISNLKYGTVKENVHDSIDAGNFAKGEKQPCTTLTNKEVLCIAKDTRKQKEIAKDYKVSIKVVSDIKSGKTWSHVTNIEYTSERFIIDSEKAKDIFMSALSRKQIASKYNVSVHVVEQIQRQTSWYESTKNLERPSKEELEINKSLDRSRNKLTKEQIIEIYLDPRTPRTIAKEYPVCHSTIYSIQNGKNYRLITKHLNRDDHKKKEEGDV